MSKPEKGHKSKCFTEPVTQARIDSFASAIGARSREEAPPTFMTVFRQGEFQILQECEVPLSSLLHAEQTYEYRGAIRAGDDVQYETVLSNLLEKQGSAGKMQFFTFETSVRSERAGDLGIARTLIVVRQPRG